LKRVHFYDYETYIEYLGRLLKQIPNQHPYPTGWSVDGWIGWWVDQVDWMAQLHTQCCAVLAFRLLFGRSALLSIMPLGLTSST